MTDEIIVAIYDTPAHAGLAAADLKQAGVPENDISVHANRPMTGAATEAAPVRDQGFWSGLFGGEPDHDTAVYDRSLANGSTVVAVRTPATHIDRVMELLESHKPIDIDERATSYGIAHTATTPTPPSVAPAAPTGVATSAAAGAGESLQLAEERLVVGKRVVNRGGTRIRRFVVETPVEESVTLHDEKVILERRPVTDGRPVAEDSFSEKTIEMTESAEEAVVSKTARVYEEIGLKKTASDRVETVRDTVRKEEVEVVRIPGTATTTATATATGPATAPRPTKT